jgi:hypothetical protein
MSPCSSMCCVCIRPLQFHVRTDTLHTQTHKNTHTHTHTHTLHTCVLSLYSPLAGKQGLKGSSLAVSLACNFALAQPYDLPLPSLESCLHSHQNNTQATQSSWSSHTPCTRMSPHTLLGTHAAGGMQGEGCAEYHTHTVGKGDRQGGGCTGEGVSSSQEGGLGAARRDRGYARGGGEGSLELPLQPRLLFVCRLLKRLHSELAGWLVSCVHELQLLHGAANSRGIEA